ncbi:MAG: FG-GAP repeat protein [Clostridiales bacterium]|nr:FG-GAP repeat protein [Clostridiales bacterium]
MKKIKNKIAIMMGLCMVFSICACEKKDAEGTTEVVITEDTTVLKETEKTEETEAEEETYFEYDEEAEDDYAEPEPSKMKGTGETLLGFDGWYLEKEPAGDIFNTWTFYTGEGKPFATQFGFDNENGPVYSVVDFDGDGTDDMVCNCEFGGDGAQRVYVFRNNNGTIEVGQIDYDYLDKELGDDLCEMAYNLFYDSSTGKTIIYFPYHDKQEELTPKNFTYQTLEESGLF